MPDEIRLRQAQRLLRGAPTIGFLALEAQAASADAHEPVWRVPTGSTPLTLREALRFAGPPRSAPTEPPLSRPTAGPIGTLAEQPLASQLSAAEKRALDLIGDWPWLAPSHLGSLLGVSRSRVSQLRARLTRIDLVVAQTIQGQSRLTLADRSIAYLARRDRAACGYGPPPAPSFANQVGLSRIAALFGQ